MEKEFNMEGFEGFLNDIWFERVTDFPRITPEKITHLFDNNVFVYGSNKAGIHGAGAAKDAMKWGAVWGQGFGHMGQTFAIPTKDEHIKTMPLADIKPYVDRFIDYAKTRPELHFLVTKIGCGLAGLAIEDIAPMFTEARTMKNVWLPQEFVTFIDNICDKESRSRSENVDVDEQ